MALPTKTLEFECECVVHVINGEGVTDVRFRLPDYDTIYQAVQPAIAELKAYMITNGLIESHKLQVDTDLKLRPKTLTMCFTIVPFKYGGMGQA